MRKLPIIILVAVIVSGLTMMISILIGMGKAERYMLTTSRIVLNSVLVNHQTDDNVIIYNNTDYSNFINSLYSIDTDMYSYLKEGKAEGFYAHNYQISYLNEEQLLKEFKKGLQDNIGIIKAMDSESRKITIDYNNITLDLRGPNIDGIHPSLENTNEYLFNSILSYKVTFNIPYTYNTSITALLGFTINRDIDKSISVTRMYRLYN